MDAGHRETRLDGLMAFHRRRKQDSRERLLAAAVRAFADRGYFPVSIDDIATEAGVSRVTFYRHFSGKAALTAEVFREAAEYAMPLYAAIGLRSFRELDVVRAWIVEIFASDRANRRMLRVFIQATADEGGFAERAQTLIADLIERLGRTIPAFALDRNDPQDARAWHSAWLLLYELLDQSNHAALGSGVAASPVVVDLLADRFVGFVTAARA